MHIKTSLYLTPILFKSHLCSSLLSNNSLICILQLSYMTSWVGSICPFKQALILLVSYSNLISVLLYTLGTLCTSKLALILLLSHSYLISILLDTQGTLCTSKLALILLVSYSNLISVLLDTLGTLCTSKLALILLVSYSNLIFVLLQIIVLFSPFSAKVRKCPPLQAGPRFLKSAQYTAIKEVG